MKPLIFLITILILGLLLRILFISSSPPSLYGDELTITLDAYSLLNSGHDQLGNFMPLTFPMGVGRPAGYVYFSIPFIAIFGPSALGVRGLSILSGVALILLMYHLGKYLFSSEIGLMAAALMAISPWDISLSRGGFEAHFALLLAVLGIFLFIQAQKKPFLYIFSALSFGLTLHTYPTYKVSLILFLPSLFWFYRSNIHKSSRKYVAVFFTVLVLLGGLSLSQTFIGGSETRFSSINIFSQEKLLRTIEEKINFERNITQLPQTLAKYFHNRPVEYVKIIGENYLQNFSLDFLFIHGDRNPRHNMATMGQLFFVDLILILVGLLNYWQRQKKIILFLMGWIIISPIPTAIVDLPHALRSAFMLPPLIILSSLGLYTLISHKMKVLFFIGGIILAVQIIFFTQKLFFLAPNEYSQFWAYPAKFASEIAIQNRDNYDLILISDRIDSIEFAYPIYARINPTRVIDQNRNKINLGKYLFKKFDNVYLGAIPSSVLEDFFGNIQGKILYIGDPSDIKYLKSYETILGSNKLNSLILAKRGI